MKTRNKALLLMLCAVTLVATSIFGTVAYFTDNESVANTFTVGKVGLKLDEADVKTDGTLETTNRVPSNEYHLIPGHTYMKDPTVTMDKDSEKAYVRMMVRVHNYEQLEKALPKTDVENAKYYGTDGTFLLQMLCVNKNGACTWDKDKWIFETFYPGTHLKYPNTYEFRYYLTADGKSGPDKNGVLEPLFTDITVPGELNNTELAYWGGAETADGPTNPQKAVKIEVTAHAIQAGGFTTASEAWTAFEGQTN